ncbi:hypothetical protein [Hymenobacter lucidus]|uniref:Outer membrane protein beta-barrel domain-containing protein n=1 Tax=Hymenobacter lucidus TaxID=2880930 RepID=A0ABS8ASA0_9BACT|nr:hypothetical protein [Hymenobacter lucidus]MCB2408279.1 hypothetical protein [Hymenobacter lucidus]
MKSLLFAAGGLLLLLLGPPSFCQAQTTMPQPDTVRIRHISPVSGDMVEVAIDSVAFIKAVAINEVLFKNFSGQAFFGLGFAAAQYDGLNNLLRASEYPEVSENQLSYGGGGSFRFKRFVLGMEGVVYETKRETADRKTALSSSNVNNYLGYAWFNRAATTCFMPTVGLTYGSADITLTDKTQNTGTTAIGVLTGPAYSRTLHYRSTGLALGAHYEFYPFDAVVLKRCVIGLHLTYTARLGQGRYYADDFKQKVSGPALNPLLFSARGVVGFVF